MAKFKVGDRVRAVNERMAKEAPNLYPPVGTPGKIIGKEAYGILTVFWNPNENMTFNMSWVIPSDIEFVNEQEGE